MKIYLRPTYAGNFVIPVTNKLKTFTYAGKEISLRKRNYKGDIIIEIELSNLLIK